MKIRLKTTNMIPAAILCIGSISAANAADTLMGNAPHFTTSQHTLVADSTERSTTSVTENGVTTTTRSVTTSSINPISSDALVSVLNARRYELDKMIGDGMMRHAISADTAVGLQSELNRVTADWMSARSTGQPMTMNQAVTIARELDALSSNVAAALGINPLTRLTVGDTTDGTTRIVIDQFGKVIGLNSASPDIYIGTLDARRLQLENTISIGLALGTLTQDQASDLRADLARVARAQSESRTTTFNYVNALPLAMSLDDVGNQLKTVVQTVSFDPLINGNRFVVSGGAVIMLDDVMVRRAGLERRISREFATGRISAVQANILRNQLSRIADLESQMRIKGGLTFKDGRILYEQFDKVGSGLDGYIAEGKRNPISSDY
jgi:hypothetical protein